MTGESLRERKKAKVKYALQRQALLLFKERGYDNTTVDDIAEAAEVSRSTFFRYFGCKEEVVLLEDFDRNLEFAFMNQQDGSLITRARTACNDAYALLPEERQELEEIRMAIARTEPVVESVIRKHSNYSLSVIASGLSSLFGNTGTDPDLLLFAGILLGTRMAAQEMSESQGIRYIDALDHMLSRLESGIPFTRHAVHSPSHAALADTSTIDPSA